MVRFVSPAFSPSTLPFRWEGLRTISSWSVSPNWGGGMPTTSPRTPIGVAHLSSAVGRPPSWIQQPSRRQPASTGIRTQATEPLGQGYIQTYFVHSRHPLRTIRGGWASSPLPYFNCSSGSAHSRCLSTVLLAAHPGMVHRSLPRDSGDIPGNGLYTGSGRSHHREHNLHARGGGRLLFTVEPRRRQVGTALPSVFFSPSPGRGCSSSTTSHWEKTTHGYGPRPPRTMARWSCPGGG